VNIVQITPGAGGMYCGNCLRDNALVATLRQRGHSTLMLPLYLPLTLDEADQSAGTPIFFGGLNVFLDQHLSPYRHAPAWLRRWLDSPALLRWAGGKAAKTRPDHVGALTVSMLRGEEGNQARDLDELVGWLKSCPDRPDVVCLSNALLVGMAHRLRTELRAPVVCTLQGEDFFLDSLPEPHRPQAWEILSQRAAEVDLLIAPSHYYARKMAERLRLPLAKITVVHNGINLAGYEHLPAQPAQNPADQAPVLGYFARLCKEKGLDLLVAAFIELKRDGRLPRLKLRVGGSCGPGDQPFVEQMRLQLSRAGCLGDCEFHPNLERSRKIDFLRSLTIFSVPALYGEAFGLYLLEAMAAGVPVVQPRHGAFPELIESTGGGLLSDPTPGALAQVMEGLLRNPEQLRSLGQAARDAVHRDYSVERMADRMVQAFSRVVHKA
jgi:glycosyltransferase involved in cell wall biosynthesis